MKQQIKIDEINVKESQAGTDLHLLNIYLMAEVL